MKSKRIGRYEILKRIGKGGMGEVFQAHDTALERDVAIKVVADDLGEKDGRARFLREAKAAARMNHPNIVSIYDTGEERNKLFIAMELVDGQDLKTIILKRTQMTLPEKLAVIVQLCRGLQFAHERGIIHRDVKPGNIRITPQGVVKILDFGLARTAVSDLTSKNIVIGTPHYMSPEQIRGTELDGRSDLFAVGVVLYEVLCYKRPFQAVSNQAILYQILNQPHRPLMQSLPNCPPDLSNAIDCALAKDRAERFDDCEKLAQILEEIGSRGTQDIPTVPIEQPKQMGSAWRKYNFTDPVFDPEMFKGRDEIRDELVEGLRNSDSFAVIGGTRMGKTSLLVQVKRTLLEEAGPASALQVYPVFVSTHELPSLSRKAIYRKIILELKSVDASPLEDPATSEDSAFEVFVHLLKKVIQDSNFVIAVLMDEVDEMQGHQWSNHFFNNLRHLISQSEMKDRLAIVVAGSLAISKLYKVASSPFLNVITATKCLRVLPPAATRELICQPTANLLDDQLVGEIIAQAGGHPFLTQFVMRNLCRKLKSRLHTASSAHVAEVVDKFLRDRSDFEHWTRGFGDLEKSVYQLIIRHESITHDEIAQAMQGAPFNRAIELLAHTGVIAEKGRNVFSGGSLMFRTWFEENFSTASSSTTKK